MKVVEVDVITHQVTSTGQSTKILVTWCVMGSVKYDRLDESRS